MNHPTTIVDPGDYVELYFCMWPSEAFGTPEWLQQSYSVNDLYEFTLDTMHLYPFAASCYFYEQSQNCILIEKLKKCLPIKQEENVIYILVDLYTTQITITELFCMPKFGYKSANFTITKKSKIWTVLEAPISQNPIYSLLDHEIKKKLEYKDS